MILGDPAGDPVDATPQVDTPQRRGPMAAPFPKTQRHFTPVNPRQRRSAKRIYALAHEYVARRDAGGVVEQTGWTMSTPTCWCANRFPATIWFREGNVNQGNCLSNPIRADAHADGVGVELVQDIAGFVRIAPC
jgi:hypothetical protein